MDRITYNFPLDVMKMSYQRTIQGIQVGDTLARRIVVTLRAGNKPYEFPTDNTVSALMYVLKPNAETPSINACAINPFDGTITYDILQEDVETEGIVEMQMKIIKTHASAPSIVIVAPKFTLEVEGNNVEDSEAESSPTYTALEEAIAQAQADHNKALADITDDADGRIIFELNDGTQYESEAAIIAMNTVGQALIEEAQAKVDEASGYADDASASASASAESAEEAAGYVQTVQDSADDAAESATASAESATASANSATEAAGYVSDAEDMANSSEAWANGTIGGNPVPTTHPAHNNNAEYWKNQAQAIAGGEDLVKYTQQSKTSAEQAQARSNIGAMASADKGVAYGVASLDGDGRVPYSQLPESAMEYKGTWNASTNTPTLTDGVGTNGDLYVVSVGGTWGGVEFFANDRIIYDGTTQKWQRIGGGNVTSVAGKTGAVTLVKSDVGLGNVDNTSDLDKPISTATRNALDDKSEVGHTHSASDITSGTLPVLRGGTGKNAIASTQYTDYEYRGESLNSSDTTPTENGTIAWTYA